MSNAVKPTFSRMCGGPIAPFIRFLQQLSVTVLTMLRVLSLFNY